MLQPEDFRQPKAMAKPAAPDDLKAIAGIGPKLETGAERAGHLDLWPDRGLDGGRGRLGGRLSVGFKGRIGRDDWIGQAAALAEIETKH